MEPLEPSREQLRAWLDAAATLALDYTSGIRERRVYPQTSSSAIRALLDPMLPRDGVPFDHLLAAFRDTIVPLARQNAHPRMFGYVQSPGVAIAAVADLLASVLNANLTVWRSAPAPIELERLTVNWIAQILGFDENAGGCFVSGGSMANLSALATARQAKAAGSRKQMRIYASSETHHSIDKAAALLGIGRDNVRHIAPDERLRIDVAALRDAITIDIAAGHQPFCVVANAGTVNTGAVDSLGQLREVANEFGMWLHIDGSYGAFAILADQTRELFARIGEADSVALDPHKWLYLPVDCGCIIYRDPQLARATFGYEAEYTKVLGEEADEAFAFWDYSPELSRRFRALKVWMLLKTVGLDSLGHSIGKDIACAKHFESLVRRSADFEMLAPVELSIFCFRHRLARCTSDAELDAWNEKLLLALQRDGSSYLSNTRINGHFALRGCVLNYRTQLSDMEVLLGDLRRVARDLTTPD